jgi:hypothetical protein
MTSIVGMIDKKKGNVMIGGDSAGVSGLDISVVSQPKVFKKGDFIFGCTTSFRMIQLLRFSFNIPNVTQNQAGFGSLNQNDVDIYEYMCTRFVDSLRNCMKEGGFLTNQNGVETGGTFLIGYKNRLFRIESDFNVHELLQGYDAVGCGTNYVLGTLFAIERKCPELDMREKLTSALECAVEFSGGVRPPFTFVET